MFQTEVVEKIKTHISCYIYIFENRAVYVICSVELEMPHMPVWCMRFARWITKATDTHSEHAILIAFNGYNGFAKATHCYVNTYIVCFDFLFFAFQLLSLQIKFVFTSYSLIMQTFFPHISLNILTSW